MFSDPWLVRWLPLIAQRLGQGPALEIGCGYGDDTVTLVNAGVDVMAFDLSNACVVAAKLRVPGARIECRDIRDPFPEEVSQLGVVVASLSLHYFSWEETTSILQKIHAGMKPEGLLLCRLNSTEDHNFGAGLGMQIEENFYSANGQHKRFFDEPALERLFSRDWNCLSMEHMISLKYLRPKALWEVVLEKRPQCAV